MKKIKFRESFKELKLKLKDYKDNMMIVKPKLIEFRNKLVILKMMI